MRTPEPGTGRIAALFVIALIAVALGASALATSAPAQTVPPTPTSKTLTISGEGLATAAPDVAHVSLGVHTQGATAAEAIGENSRLMTAVLGALRSHGARSEDLRTAGLSVMPQWRSNGQEIAGYLADNSVLLTVNEVERTGELIDAALAAGANRVGGISFGVRDSAALRQQALADAGRAARARADAIATSLGLRVVGVSSVHGEPTYGARPAAAFPEIPPINPPPQSAPAPPVESGDTRVTAQVQVTFVFE